MAAATAKTIEAQRAGAYVDLGPLFGGRHEPQTPTAGAYGSTIGANRHRTLTRDRTLRRSIEGGAMLIFEHDGRAHGCFWAEITDRSTISRFASKDGKRHVSNSHDDFRLGVEGRWSADASRRSTRVILDRFSLRNCIPGSESADLDPLELDCVTVEPKALPNPVMACRIEGEHRQPRRVSLLLAGTPRDGSWDVRGDIAMRDQLELPEGTEPWLVLGMDADLRIIHFEHDEFEVRFERESVWMPEGDLVPR